MVALLLTKLPIAQTALTGLFPQILLIDLGRVLVMETVSILPLQQTRWLIQQTELLGQAPLLLLEDG